MFYRLTEVSNLNSSFHLIAGFMTCLVVLIVWPEYSRGASSRQAAPDRRDFQDSLKTLDRLARQGHATAQFRLGVLYVQGLGVKRNMARAAIWFQRAAKQGHVNAMVNLGTMYAAGRGVKKNNVLAVKWFRRAAERGDPLGMVKLGMMYANGDGVKRNDISAYVWLSLALDKRLHLAVELRDQLAARMSLKQIARARRELRKRRAVLLDRKTLKGLFR